MRILFNQTNNQSKVFSNTSTTNKNNSCLMQSKSCDSIHFKRNVHKYSPDFFRGLDKLIDEIPNTELFKVGGQPNSVAKIFAAHIKNICETGNLPISNVEGQQMANIVEYYNVDKVIKICKYVKGQTFHHDLNTTLDKYIEILSKKS